MYSPFKAVKEALLELLELILIPAEFVIATIGINRNLGLIGLVAILLLVGALICRYL